MSAILLAAMASILAGCGGSGLPPAPANPAAAVDTPTTVVLSTTGTSVVSDGSTSVTITATVLNSSNAVITNFPVDFAATGGQLSVPNGLTDTLGKASFSFNAGPSGINRTETLSVTAGAITTQIPIQVIGTSMTANPTSGFSVTDTGTITQTVTLTVLNSAGVAVTNTPVILTGSGIGTFSFTPASGSVTDNNGKLVVTITGTGAGSATLTADAAGTTAAVDFTISTVTAAYGVSAISLNGTPLTAAATNIFSSTSMKTGDTLTFTVLAPQPTTSVTFATTMGSWAGGTNTITVPVNTTTRLAIASLTTTSAGLATVQAIDSNPLNPPASDSVSVSMTAVTPNSITLQASPSVIPKSSGATTGTSTLIATVKDAAGLPVGGAPVVFNILNPTGGGESVSPVIAYTASTTGNGLSLGQAMTTFTSGSLSSGATGIQVRASILGDPNPCPSATCVSTEANTNPATNVSPSGNDASIVIGGSAGSVAFGQATVLSQNTNTSAYILPMSVMVADSNGNPAPLGTVVNLSLWPIAWSTGSNCTPDFDGVVDPNTGVTTWLNQGTFYNEDVNENLILDPNEDGNRTYYASGTSAPGINTPGLGTVDSLITPVNSTAGTLPATVTTDASGIATFELTYPKTSGIWTVVRIRGRTVVQGSDAVGEVQFRLGALKADTQPCILPPSPHNF